MPRLEHFLLLVAMLTVCCGDSQGQSGETGTITGTVRNLQGQTLSGASVRLTLVGDGAPSSSMVATTATDGTYRLAGVDYGRYRLSSNLTGYEESAMQIIDLTHESAIIDVTLKRAVQVTTGGGFIGSDTSESGRPVFRASDVEGSTAPSGYSAGASVEDALHIPLKTPPTPTGNDALPSAKGPDSRQKTRCARTKGNVVQEHVHVSTVQLAQALSLMGICP